jgi:hypothetical protein
MDSSEYNQRNRSNKNEDSVEDEVQRLLKSNDGSNKMMNIRDKYARNPEIIDKIENSFQEKHRKITKKAKKFAKLIRDKYSNRQYPFHVLLDKAKLFKIKHNLSDSEFAEFHRIYEQELVGIKSPDVYAVSTNMMKILGSISTDFHGSLNVSEGDYKYVQDIIKLHAASRNLHAQVLLQSMQYTDCGFEALTGKYDRISGHRPGDSVHPVIAALFIPKIPVLESHFLHSSIANIVKSRYNKEPISTRPDFELFDALTRDPNDVVCDNKSPVLDLLTRSQLQVQLWNSVLNLRNGQYYNNSFREFITNIDMCKLNKHDNPDLVYGRFDGVILKRLLSAFSFRPTLVATMPVYNTIVINPYQQHSIPIVTSVPMINFRLPPPSATNNEPVELSDALEQSQYFVENGIMIPKQTSIIYSKGVLFFYVDRRAHTLRFNDMQPFNISRLPVSITGFERLNDTRVQFNETISIGEDEYQLRSVVVAEVNNNTVERNIVVGSSAIFLISPTKNPNVVVNEYFQYDPLSVNNMVESSANSNQYVNRQPVNSIDGTPGRSEPGESFYEMAQERGIIFMYELVKDESKGDIHY